MAKKRKKKTASAVAAGTNFVGAAGPGCFIAHAGSTPAWALGRSSLADLFPDEFAEGSGPDAAVFADVPDIGFDPDEHVLSVVNKSPTTVRVFYVTVFHPCVGGGGTALTSGRTVSALGVEQACTTFIAVVEPHGILELCEVGLAPDDDGPELESDVTDIDGTRVPVPRAPLTDPVFALPLQGLGDDGCGFLCTQGFGGTLTHFFPETFYAIDFRCAVGTPCVAVADGRVVKVTDTNTCSGICVSNLFSWNCVILELDDGHQVEYVHIQEGSAVVKAGDRVVQGQVLCASGSVGFSPEPHLHFEAHRTNADDAPSVPFFFCPGTAFDAPDRANVAALKYEAVAGKRYSHRGCETA